MGWRGRQHLGFQGGGQDSYCSVLATPVVHADCATVVQMCTLLRQIHVTVMDSICKQFDMIHKANNKTGYGNNFCLVSLFQCFLWSLNTLTLTVSLVSMYLSTV